MLGQTIGMTLLGLAVVLMVLNTVGLFLPLRCSLVSADREDLPAGACPVA